MHGSGDDAVSLQAAQLLDQHLLRNARNGPFKLAEAQRPLAKELEQDRELPPSSTFNAD
jgi:hypothetical protein